MNWKRLATEYGFADSAFTRWEGKVCWVLVAPYLPVRRAEPPEIALSGYYVVAQQSYLNLKKLQEALRERGMASEEFREHHIKQIAAQTGGRPGKNTLYIHPEYGSFVHIRVLVLESGGAEVCAQPQDGCGSCTRCAQACPVGAIDAAGFHRERCVREYLTQDEMPEFMRGHVYQLYGCERCQTCCPHNNGAQQEGIRLDAAEILKGNMHARLKELVGVNYAKRRYYIKQTLLYCVRNRMVALLPEIEALVEDAQCGETAQWAAQRLRGIAGET